MFAGVDAVVDEGACRRGFPVGSGGEGFGGAVGVGDAQVEEDGGAVAPGGAVEVPDGQ